MSDNTTATKKTFSFDWLIRGVLTKFGDIFDTLTGRRWKPSSSLATSELTEKLKKLLDLEVKDLGGKGKFVPHNLKLKMQWDKFSTDSEKALKPLQNELLIAAIDHINDNRYQTYEPINLEVKPDYFTEGVKLIASFDKLGSEENEVAVNVTVPEIKVGNYAPEPIAEIEQTKEFFTAEFSINGKPKSVDLEFTNGMRRNVGRNNQNDLAIDDASVSKIHAALVLNKEDQLQIADTGSTNGTFINDQRISYGKAITISDADKIKFGTVEVSFKRHKRDESVERTASGNLSENASDKTALSLNSADLTSNAIFPTAESSIENGRKAESIVNERKADYSTAQDLAEKENKDITRQDIDFDFEKRTGGEQK